MASRDTPRRSTRKRCREAKENEFEQSSGLIPAGSPWDQLPRKKLAMEDIDVEKSYVDEIKSNPPPAPSQPVKKPKQKRWKRWRGKEPLNNPAKLPKNWTMHEFDLAEDDIDGRIARCHERLEDNIMPAVFRQRLRDKMVSSESEHLSLETVQRVDTLKAIEKNLIANGDEHGQLPNVRAVLEAYRSGDLAWYPNLVTYWSEGKQLCKPRPFDWDEFEVINASVQGHRSFWTEGCYIALRIPGYDWWAEFPFLYDTGASIMNVYHGDLRTIMGPFGPPNEPNASIIGVTSLRDASNNDRYQPIIELEATILTDRGPNAQRLTPWTRVAVTVNDGDYVGPPYGTVRLDGPFIRSQLFTGTAPPVIDTMVIAQSARGLRLPTRDLTNWPPGPMNTFMHPVPPGQPTNLPPLVPLVEGLARKGKKAPPPAPGVSS
ncbi:hypothetical protein N7512_005378 [Penicillium capsulatum]|nr:hypothetical protein N7512_005378 [Penicillium capsulatum]